VSVETIRAAYEALAAGEAEPLVALIDPQMEWRGRRRLQHFWRPPPS
jgi:hypothetical protein